MDLEHNKRSDSWSDKELSLNRDKAMYENIKKYSDSEDSKILVLVGAAHNPIANLLKQTGEYTINEIYFDIHTSKASHIQHVEAESIKELRERATNQTNNLHIKISSQPELNSAANNAESIFQTVAPKLYIKEALGEHFEQDQQIIHLINEYAANKETQLTGQCDDKDYQETNDTCNIQ